MPNREADINLSSTNIPSFDPDSPNYDEAKHMARIAEVLERGILAERTRVELPGNMYGEWVNRDPIEVERMKSIGFQIDTEFAARRGIHDTGDGSVVIGDVVFMTAPMHVKKMIDTWNAKKFRDANDPKKAKEAIAFRANLKAQRLAGVEIPDIDTSSLDGVYGNEIAEQLTADSNSQRSSVGGVQFTTSGPQGNK